MSDTLKINSVKVQLLADGTTRYQDFDPKGKVIAEWTEIVSQWAEQQARLDAAVKQATQEAKDFASQMAAIKVLTPVVVVK
jgi:hypothetical protein